MYTLRTRNVNTAFKELVQEFRDWRRSGWGFVRSESRNGPVLALDGPICVTYEIPTERVLFNPGRDCNPFFHLIESMWMLVGRNDLKTLTKYVSTFGDYSDDGLTLNGAYGYRWRHSSTNQNSPFEEEHDQLTILINHLKSTPNTRRAVLQMWNVQDDLLKIDSSKDVCCNLCVVFQVRNCTRSELRPERFNRVGPNWKDDSEGRRPAEDLSERLYGTRDHVRFSTDSQTWLVYNPEIKYQVLDMTVYNRSNDLIWGMLGANAVHFSFLQEYVAVCCGFAVGRYHQISNNCHLYVQKAQFDTWLEDTTDLYQSWESDPAIKQVPLMRELDQEGFDFYLKDFFKSNDEQRPYPIKTGSFLTSVVVPAVVSFQAHKFRDYQEAIRQADRIKSDDWRTVCLEWLYKRKAKHESKTST